MGQKSTPLRIKENDTKPTKIQLEGKLARRHRVLHMNMGNGGLRQ